MEKEEIETKLKKHWSEAYPFMVDIDKGWYALVSDLVDELTAFNPSFKVAQVKQKFGGLRFYLESYEVDFDGQSVLDCKMYQLVSEAESKSLKVCELCGEEGTLREKDRWIRTLCDEHAMTY